MNETIKKEIKKIFESKESQRDFVPGKTKIPLAAPSFSYEEVEDAERLVTRAELAEFLAYTPRFERKIARLIDWEKGYKAVKE